MAMLAEWESAGTQSVEARDAAQPPHAQDACGEAVLLPL